MKMIYKYPLEAAYSQLVAMPGEAVFLSVQMQHDRPTLWALVDTDAPERYRKVFFIGTGHPVNDEVQQAAYVSTVQDRQFVWHIFVSTP